MHSVIQRDDNPVYLQVCSTMLKRYNITEPFDRHIIICIRTRIDDDKFGQKTRIRSDLTYCYPYCCSSISAYRYSEHSFDCERLPILSNLLNTEKQIQVKTQEYDCYNYKSGPVSVNEDSVKKQYDNINNQADKLRIQIL